MLRTEGLNLQRVWGKASSGKKMAQNPAFWYILNCIKESNNFIQSVGLLLNKKNAQKCISATKKGSDWVTSPTPPPRSGHWIEIFGKVYCAILNNSAMLYKTLAIEGWVSSHKSQILFLILRLNFKKLTIQPKENSQLWLLSGLSN